MNDNFQNYCGPGHVDFEGLVTAHYRALYQFAFSLTNSDADASDLTQQTFCIWAIKGSQLRDVTKVKTWLFTTLHRAFLAAHRRQIRFSHLELSQVEEELPRLSPAVAAQPDVHQLLQALKQLDAGHQAAVALFYLEDCQYKEIAQILGVPLGTVKSRIARGLNKLHGLLAINLPGETVRSRQSAKDR